MFDMAITNLGKAEEIIKKIPLGYFGNKKALLDGTGTTLSLKIDDIRNFAYKMHDNILDKCCEIGRLYAESLLTRTTAHKVNDYKNVYYEFQSYMAESRNDFYELFEGEQLAQSGNDVKAKAEDISKKLKDFVEKCKNKNDSYIFSQLADIVGVTDQQKAKYIERMKEYAQKIDMNLNKIGSILDNSNFSKILDERIKSATDSELLTSARQVIKDSGLHFSPNKLKDRAKNMQSLSDMYSLLVGTPMFGAVGIGIAVGIGATTLGMLAGAHPLLLCSVGPLLILAMLALAGMLEYGAFETVKDWAKKLGVVITVRRFKSMLNNFNKYVSNIFEEIGDMKRYTMSLTKNKGDKDAYDKSENAVSDGLLKKLDDRVGEFVRRTAAIWQKYATAEGKVYTNFQDRLIWAQENPKKIGELESKLAELEQKKKRQEAYINGLKLERFKILKDIRALKTEIDKDSGKKEMLSRSLTLMQAEKKKKDIAIAEANSMLSEIEKKIIDFQTQKSTLEEQMALPQKGEGKDKRHRSGVFHKSNNNTSSLGKAKQGLARTLWGGLRYQYGKPKNKSALNLDLD